MIMNNKTFPFTGISCVQFDDTRIASGSYDKTIRVWDIKSDESNVVLTLAGHSGTVRCLNLNGNRLVSGSVDRTIKVCLTSRMLCCDIFSQSIVVNCI